MPPASQFTLGAEDAGPEVTGTEVAEDDTLPRKPAVVAKPLRIHRG